MHSMHRRALGLAGLSLLLAALVPSAGQGQRAPRARVGGTWTYDGPAAQGEAIVRGAVEPIVAGMRPDLQRIAEERIAESTWLPTRIRIGVRPRRIEVALTGRERRTFASAPAQVLQVPTRHGYAQLTQSVRADGGVQQDFTSLDGTQQNLYVPGPNSRSMILDVTLRSPYFPSDIHFQLAYRRGR